MTTTIIDTDQTLNHNLGNLPDLVILEDETLEIAENVTYTISRFAEIDNQGNLRNFGTIDSNGDIENGGDIDNFGIFNNFGSIDNTGFFDNIGIINNYDFLITSRDLSNDGLINNQDSLRNTEFLGNFSDGTIENSGTLENFYILENEGTINNTGSFINIGTFSNFGTFNNSGTFNNTGTIRGTGDVIGNLSLTEGILSPGGLGRNADTNGTFSIEGDLNFTGGRLAISLSGVDGGDFDILNVTDDATLRGIDLQFSINENGLRDDLEEGETATIAFFQSGNLNNSLNLNNFTPTDTSDFDYTLQQSGNNLSLTIERLVINDPPIAEDDFATTRLNTPVTIPVLANDSDPNGDTLTIINVEDSPHGTIAIENDTLIFTPNSGFSGTANFNYTIDDGSGETATASVTVEVGTVQNGGNGKQTLEGNNGDDLLDGGNAKDRLLGNGGNDTLLGGNGADQIFGGSGDDLISGGRGDDTLNGGDGNDTFVLIRGNGSDTIQDFAVESDRLNLTNGLTSSRINVVLEGNNALVKTGDDILATLIGVTTTEITIV
ncbi:Ig-like domain-containing protein [Aerosakkonemataceae cyanobacterium BLCC-F154]|uniref:Ig-like domain-containing protein n=1 Tax=Floridaenema fluviatile BLCC-F154 TaxID=3153640 RepID=A0ABV4Y4M0_9CYAN